MGPLVWGWLALLVTLNAILPTYFLPLLEARITLIIFLVGFGLMILLTHLYGFTRILGLGHFLWIPLVFFLAFRINLHEIQSPLNLWMAGVILCNSISLVIDIQDVYRYLNGDKAPFV